MNFATFTPIIKEINSDFDQNNWNMSEDLSGYIFNETPLIIDNSSDQLPIVGSSEKKINRFQPIKDRSYEKQTPTEINNIITYTPSKSKNEFINTFKPIVKKFSEKTGLNSKLLLAQIALETGWGKSVPGFNVGGIKYTGKGDSQTLMTKEFINGVEKTLPQTFRKFASLEEGVEAYVNLLLGKRYERLRNTTDPYEGARILQESGYATDPEYSKKLSKILDMI